MPSIFAWIVRVGHALAATWRGAAHRRWQQQQQQMAPGVPRARCLFGAVHGLGGGALLHGLGGGTSLNGLGGGTLLNGLGGGASLLQQATRSWRSWGPANTPRSLSSILVLPTLHGSGCDWLLSIFAWIVRVGHALATTWRGATHRRWHQQQRQMAPGVLRTRCLSGAVRLVAVDLCMDRSRGPCTRCHLARCSASTT